MTENATPEPLRRFAVGMTINTVGEVDLVEHNTPTGDYVKAQDALALQRETEKLRVQVGNLVTMLDARTNEAFEMARECTSLRAECDRLRGALERIADETAATWVQDVARAALASTADGGEGER